MADLDEVDTPDEQRFVSMKISAAYLRLYRMRYLLVKYFRDRDFDELLYG